MTKGTSIRIFLLDGTPDGLRLVEKSLWTGIAVVCSRNQYPAVRNRDEFGRPGIYVLTGPDPDVAGGQLAYIGQAELARQRLDQHSKNKDFWTQLVLFTNKDANLNNAHYRYLEAKLIELGYQAKRAKLENGNQPGLVQLSEPEIADAEAFLANMLTIYPLMGIDAFEVVSSTLEVPPQAPLTPTEHFTMSGRGALAHGRLTAEGFLVEKDSIAVGQVVPSFDGGYRALRNELIRNGVLIAEGEKARFTQDYAFKSPSAAGSVVRGRATNGRIEWRTLDGRTLAEIQESLLEQSALGAPPTSSELEGDAGPTDELPVTFDTEVD